MKKIYTVMAACLFAVTMMAQTITIPKLAAGSTFTADGQIESFWGLVDENDIAELQPSTSAADVTSASFKMVWNDTALIVLLQVEDNSLCDEWCTAGADWSSDRFEIFFDSYTLDLNDGVGASFDDPANWGPWNGHYQFTGPWLREGCMDTASVVGSQWPKSVPYTFGFHRQGNSANYEMIVAFTNLTTDTVGTELQTPAIVMPHAAGTEFGFQAAWADVDDDAPTQKDIIAWLGGDLDCWANMDGANTIELSSTEVANTSGINDISFNTITVSPNPANEYIKINNLFQEAEYTITNVAGRLEKKGLTSGTIDITGLKSGLYFINVSNKTLKFVVE